MRVECEVDVQESDDQVNDLNSAHGHVSCYPPSGTSFLGQHRDRVYLAMRSLGFKSLGIGMFETVEKIELEQRHTRGYHPRYLIPKRHEERRFSRVQLGHAPNGQ